MKTLEELKQTPEYWLCTIQNEIFRQVKFYMDKEKLDKTQFANKFDFSKRYVSSILNGNFNGSLEKLIELSLKINVYPIIEYKQIK